MKIKNEFELLIQKDMLESDKEVCKRFLNWFAERTLKDPKKRYFGQNTGGYTTGLWRGRYGREIGYWTDYRNTTKPIVFRRLSKNKRLFGCVYSDSLIVKNDSYLFKSHDTYRELCSDGELPSMCLCPKHKASIKVDWRNGRPELESYFKVGN